MCPAPGRARNGTGRLTLRQYRRLRGTGEPALFAFLADGAPLADDVVAAGGGADVRLHRSWLARDRADAKLDAIRRETIWIAERRMMYDRIVDVPREKALFGHGCDREFPTHLEDLRRELEIFCGATFAYVLLNRYRDGRDSVAWHSDREIRDGEACTIASLTLGTTRAFDIRPKADRRRVVSVDLDHGDLLVLADRTQTHYEHRVAKDSRIAGERINLTFRSVRSPR